MKTSLRMAAAATLHSSCVRQHKDLANKMARDFKYISFGAIEQRAVDCKEAKAALDLIRESNEFILSQAMQELAWELLTEHA